MLKRTRVKRLMSCWLALIGILFCATAALGQGGGGQQRQGGPHAIRGKVLMPSGVTPERRVHVVLEVSTGGILGDTFTDSVGNFEFRSLSNGTYTVTVRSDNQTYESAQERVELSGGFARTVEVQFFLRPRATDPNVATNRILTVADTQEVPPNAKKLYEKALKLVKDNKEQAALAQYQAALEIFPDYLHALHKLGELFVQRGQPFDAQLCFERALTVNTRFALPHIGLGALLYQQGKISEAIEHLELANKLDESYPQAHVNLGLALMESKPPDFARAEKELTRGMALAGKEGAHIYLYLFNLHVRQRQYPQAAAALEAFLKEKPNAMDSVAISQKLEAVKKLIAQQAAKQAAGGAAQTKP